MKRRDFIVASTLVAGASLRAMAQDLPRRYRVALLPYWRRLGPMEISVKAFRERMAEHGFVEGRNLEVRVFDAGGPGLEQFPDVVREALSWKPDAIQVSTSPGVRAVRKATDSIPIVFTRVNDPTANGLVESIARPGGNVTGVMVHQALLTSKRLELVREVLPEARRVAMILDLSMRAFSAESIEQIRASARRLEFALDEIDPSQEARHLAGAFDRAADLGVDAVVPAAYSRTDGRDGAGWASISVGTIAWQGKRRIPVISGFKEDVEDGYFASVGSSRIEEWQLAAELTAGIFKGGNPATMAIQQLNRIEVAISLRVARELGIKVPKSVLLRADKVIE